MHDAHLPPVVGLHYFALTRGRRGAAKKLGGRDNPSDHLKIQQKLQFEAPDLYDKI